MHTKNNKTDAASPEVVLNEALKNMQKDYAILDGPVTNRALLLAAAYLGEVIRCAAGKDKYSEEHVVLTWSDLQNDLLSEIRENVRADAEWLHRLSRPASQGSSGDAAASQDD